MGASADDYLTEQSLTAAFGKGYDEGDMDSTLKAAEDLAVTDGMPLRKAIEIVSGQTAQPYGTARTKGKNHGKPPAYTR